MSSVLCITHLTSKSTIELASFKERFPGHEDCNGAPGRHLGPPWPDDLSNAKMDNRAGELPRTGCNSQTTASSVTFFQR